MTRLNIKKLTGGKAEKEKAKEVERQKVKVQQPTPRSKEELEGELGKLRFAEKKSREKVRGMGEDGITPDEKQKIAQQERILEQNKRDQAALLDAIKKLTETTANLKND